jgi:hypothetical protein
VLVIATGAAGDDADHCLRSSKAVVGARRCGLSTSAQEPGRWQFRWITKKAIQRGRSRE